MVGKEYLLSSSQMAQFVARGFLRFDELIPKELNEAIMRDIDGGTVKAQAAGTPLSQCYPPPSVLCTANRGRQSCKSRLKTAARDQPNAVTHH